MNIQVDQTGYVYVLDRGGHHAGCFGDSTPLCWVFIALFIPDFGSSDATHEINLKISGVQTNTAESVQAGGRVEPDAAPV